MEPKKRTEREEFPDADETALLSGFFDIGPAPMCLMTPEGIVRRINRSFGRLLGREPEALAGGSISGFLCEEDVRAVLGRVAALQEGDRPGRQVCRIRTQAEGCRSVEWSFRRHNGLIYGFLQDITGILSVEDALKERNDAILSESLKGRGMTPGSPARSLSDVLLPTETVFFLGSLRNAGCAYGVVKDMSATQEALGRFYKMLDSMPAMIAITDAKSDKLIEVNAAFTETLGYGWEEAVGRTAEELGLYADAGDRREILRLIGVQGGVRGREVRLRDKTGRLVECLCSGTTLEADSTLTLFLVMLDVTEMKEIQQKSAEQSRFLNSLLNSMPEAVFSKNAEGVYLSCNPACAEFLGLPGEAVVGKTDFELFDPELARRLRSQDAEVMRSGKMIHCEEWIAYRQTGRRLHEILKAPLLDDGGSVIGMIGISRDITESRRREEEYRYLGFHDGLTGLYNRRFYEAELARMDVERNLPLTVILGDVNALKFVNDAFGHSQGDLLIRRTAQAIRKSCRAEDVLARIGGDEFALVLPRTDFSAAQCVIERIHQYLAQEEDIIGISVSLGFATKVSSAQDIHEVIKKAEDRMYRNKLSRRLDAGGQAVDAILSALYTRSRAEREHSRRMGELCGRLALRMGMGGAAADRMKLAGLLHDIGKIELEAEVLNKKEAMTPGESERMRRHPELGYRILSAAEGFAEIARYVYQHHENWDGSGYPKALRGEEILLPARIIAVAEAYDDMVNPAFQDADYGEILEELTRCAGTKFDPEVVRAFVEAFPRRPEAVAVEYPDA